MLETEGGFEDGPDKSVRVDNDELEAKDSRDDPTICFSVGFPGAC